MCRRRVRVIGGTACYPAKTSRPQEATGEPLHSGVRFWSQAEAEVAAARVIAARGPPPRATEGFTLLAAYPGLAPH
jgi:hypothetical protein